MLRKRKQDIKQPKITPSSRKTKVSKQVSKKVIEGKKIKIVAIKDKPTKKLKVSKLKAIIAPTIKVKEKNTSLKLKIKCTKKVKRKKRKIKRVELTCVLTGLKKKLNTVKVREMAVKLRFKDETDFINNFLSRTACTLLKQGYTENEIKQKFNFQSETVVSFDLIKKYIKAFNYKEKMLQRRKRKIVNDIIDLQNSSQKLVAEYNPIPLNFNNPEHIKYLTSGACIRPDIHLDGDYSCNLCPIFEHCACSRKFWNKKLEKQNAKSNKKIKRL